MRLIIAKTMPVAFVLIGSHPALASAAGPQPGHTLPVWSILPFIGLILTFVVFPLTLPRFWYRHFGKISACWALAFAVPFLWFFRSLAFHELLKMIVIDYIPFMVLLWGLFTISGSIVIRGSLRGTPLVNTMLLLSGTILASWVGTTGASMLMIRPVLRANETRLRKVHVICFFIFLVSNIGGALTPLGDPPLFLGFLHNVPFFWVTGTLFLPFLLTTGLLLVLFYLFDLYSYRQEQAFQTNEGEQDNKRPLRIEGLYNLICLAGIIGAILLSGSWAPGNLNLAGVAVPVQNIARDSAIVLLGLISLKITKKELRDENNFTWEPMLEVAKLFAAIFITIIPVLAILKSGNKGAFAPLMNNMDSPALFFWVTGVLSSFLDNAPTYLTFFNLALSKAGLLESQIPAALLAGAASANPEFISFLKAISAGAVFMGANSYIGNAPNFMIKAIAEDAGVNMPSFLGYMIKYSIPILLPVFVIVTLVFF